jgi:hypothetical protein
MHEHEYIVLEGHQALRDVRVSLGVSSLRLSPVYLGWWDCMHVHLAGTPCPWEQPNNKLPKGYTRSITLR